MPGEMDRGLAASRRPRQLKMMTPFQSAVDAQSWSDSSRCDKAHRYAADSTHLRAVAVRNSAHNSAHSDVYNYVYNYVANASTNAGRAFSLATYAPRWGIWSSIRPRRPDITHE